jgi:hypothetical protein
MVDPDPLFESAWLKWGRAVVHAQALKADLDATTSDATRQPTFAVEAEYQPKRHGFAVVVTDIDPMPPTWGLLLGDIANNLRSALDQTAWAIVTRGRTPPGTLSKKAQRRVYFPICKERQDFNGSLPAMLPGARRADIARVRRYQPYQHARGIRAWFSFALLAKINTGDKHRTTEPVWALPLRTAIEVTQMRDCEVPSRNSAGKRRALKVGMELAFVHARKTGPQPHIEAIPHLAAEPMIEEGVLLREWLRVTVFWTEKLLREFSEMPPAIEHVGIDIDALRAIYDWEPPPDA